MEGGLRYEPIGSYVNSRGEAREMVDAHMSANDWTLNRLRDARSVPPKFTREDREESLAWLMKFPVERERLERDPEALEKWLNG